MSDAPDFAALARQYLDLWEDQLGAMAADPELAGQSARFFEALARFGAAANPAMMAGMTTLMRQAGLPGPFPGAGDDGPTAPGTAPGAAASAAAPGDRDQRLDELAGRLDALEERLARLEAGSRGKGGGARKRGAGGGRAGNGRKRD